MIVSRTLPKHIKKANGFKMPNRGRVLIFIYLLEHLLSAINHV